MKDKSNKYIGLGVIGGLLVSVNIVGNRWVVREYGSSSQLLLLGTRMFIVGLILMCVLNSKEEKRVIRHMDRKLLGYIILYTFVMYIVGYTINSVALVGITAGMAGVAEQTRVLFNVVIGFLIFKKRVSKSDYKKLFVYIVGLILFTYSSSVGGKFIYAVLEVVSVVIFAYGDNLLKSASDKLGVSTRCILSVGMTAGGALMAVTHLKSFDGMDTLGIVLLVSMILSNVANAYIKTVILDNLTPYKANLAMTSSALGAIFLGYAVAKDGFSVMSVIALSVIFSANFVDIGIDKIKYVYGGLRRMVSCVNISNSKNKSDVYDYKIQDLDKRLCDINGGTNEMTIREFIKHGHTKLGAKTPVTDEKIESLSENELNDWIEELDWLLSK